MTRSLQYLLLGAVTAGGVSSAFAADYPLGPNEKRGFNPETTYAVGDLDTVNLYNGNMTLRIPVTGDMPISDGVSFGLVLTYNGKAWDYVPGGTATQPAEFATPDRLSNAGVGWRVSLGTLLPPGETNGPLGFLSGWLYIAPDGGDHQFYSRLGGNGDWEGGCSGNGPCYTRDGSYLRLTFEGSLRVVAFPDGTRHVFTNLGTTSSERWLLTEVYGPHAVDVAPDLRVSYEPDAACALSPEVWTITDRHQRKTQVCFVTDSTGKFPGLVGFITWPKFNGSDVDRAGVTFSYQTAQLVPACTSFSTVVQQHNVPVLSRLVLPDGSYYEMAYNSGVTSPPCGDPGGALLRSLRLPTGGRIEWQYQLRGLPVITGCTEAVWVANTPAVWQRSLFDRSGANLGIWTYDSELEGSTSTPILPWDAEHQPCHAYESGTGPPEALKVTVVNPLGQRTVHHFSAFPGVPPPLEDAGGATTNFRASEQGLPFSRLHESSGLFLSTEVYDPGLVRRTYVNYEEDKDCFEGTEPVVCPSHGVNNNPRLQAKKVDYVDDGGLFTRTDYSDFDGAGHHRKASQTSNFPVPSDSSLETVTQWNGSRQGLPLPGEQWILDTYTSTESRADSKTFRSLYDFDPSNGFLRSVRRLKSTAADPRTGKNDVLVRYTPTGDNIGQVATEEWLGGDCPDPILSCNPMSVPTYTFQHGYSFGVRNLTTVQLGGPGTELKLLNLSIDGPSGLMSASTDSGGVTTSFHYDSLGRLDQSTIADGSVEKLTYTLPTLTEPWRSVELTRERLIGAAVAEKANWRFDGLGRVVRDDQSLPQGQVGSVFHKYNGLGAKTDVSERVLLTNTTVGGLGTSQEDFDAFGRPRRIVAADGSVTKLAYKGIRVVERTQQVWTGSGTDAKGVEVTTKEEYDGLGRLRQVTEPSGTRTRYTYDAMGRLTNARPVDSKSAPQNRFFTYDGRGFLVSESHPETANKMTQYGYDARGNVLVTMTPTATLKSTYDRAGRPLETRVATGVAQSAYALLRSSEYYSPGTAAGSAAGRLKSETAKNWRLDASVCKAYDVIDSFGYDAAGRTEKRTTELKAAGVAKESWEQVFGYDGASRLVEQTYPRCLASCTSTERKVTTTLDMGLVTAVADATRPYTNGVSYQPNGLLSALVHSNNVTFTQASDPNQLPRPLSLSATGPGGALWSTGSYGYDGSGNIKAIGAESYTYDSRSRLRLAINPAAGTKKYRRYSYDRFGNLTEVSSGTSLTALVPWPIPVDSTTNRLALGSYNLSGSLLSWNGAQYSWDPLQQLASATNGSETWTHTYDANGERVWSWRNGSRIDTFSARDFSGRLLREFRRVAPSTTTTAEDYIYFGNRLLATIKPNGPDEEVRHIDVDHLGSVRLVTSASGSQLRQHHLWPYGEEYSSQDDDEQMRFTGHERDLWATTASTEAEAAEDDLDYMHARYYRPLLGRFLSVDPVGGDTRDPRSWNRYSYVLGNPLVLVDPEGKSWDLAFQMGRDVKESFTYRETVMSVPAEPRTRADRLATRRDRGAEIVARAGALAEPWQVPATVMAVAPIAVVGTLEAATAAELALLDATIWDFVRWGPTLVSNQLIKGSGATGASFVWAIKGGGVNKMTGYSLRFRYHIHRYNLLRPWLWFRQTPILKP